MIDWIIAGISMAAGGGATSEPPTLVTQAPAAAEAQQFQAEPQIPSGRFTTATEVKPILTATRNSWVAVREYNGQDLLYVTHLMAWRCGLLQMKYAVNGGSLQEWPLPPCLTDTAQPNAIRTEDGLPYVSFDPGSIQSVQIELLYDDLSTDGSSYERKMVLMP